MIIDQFKLAIRNLKQRKLRSWLTMLGIFISIATIFTLISLSLGLQNAVEEQFATLGTDKFFIQPGAGLSAPGSLNENILTIEDIKTIENTRGVKQLAYYVAGSARVEYNEIVRYVTIWGISIENDLYIETGNIEIEEGSFLESGSSGIVMGNLYKTGNLFEKPVNVGNKIKINNQDFKVRGILELIGNPDDDRMIMMDLETARILFDIPERIDWIVVQIEENEDIFEVTERVEQELLDKRGLTEKTKDFSIMTPKELLQSVGSILNIITAFLAGIAAISLIVGGVGIANTMYTSVIERTKEIGIMKAIGAKNKDILTLFLIEAGLLGFVGGIIGIGLGIIFSKTIEYVAMVSLGTNLLQSATPFYLIIGCLLFGFIIGAVSGTFPAWQASKTNVVDALRYE